MAEAPIEPEKEPATFEELASLEKEFEAVELEILRNSTLACAPLYTKRAHLISRIPHFWPLVLEEAPPEIAQHISPSDSAALSTLLSLTVSRFEISPDTSLVSAAAAALPDYDGASGKKGDPRNLSFVFEFGENDWVEAGVVEKRFWWRGGGLVSEPVRVRWKEGKDLTGGLLDRAVVVWEKEKRANGKGKGKDGHVEGYAELVDLVERTSQGAVSFFAWFGYRGRDGEGVEGKRAKDEDEEEEDLEEGEGMEAEIFPGGEEVAVAISEDLWPQAIKYFTQAQEHDLSDGDSDLEEEEEEDSPDADDNESESGDLRHLVAGSGSEGPPKKKLKT